MSEPKPLSPAMAALHRLFTAEQPDADWFSPVFLARVPLDTFGKAIDRLRNDHGSLVAVERRGSRIMVRLARADVPTQLTIDAGDRITGLLLQPAIPTGGNVAAYVQEIAALPGRTAVLVRSDGATIAEHKADARLAVGSVLKLPVLLALIEACREGRLAWAETVVLKSSWRSLPSGILQDWPDGACLTIESLAHLMIAISDNTATDALIDLVGRAAVERRAHGNRPFLTTREAFVLKGAKNAALRSRWRSACANEKRAMLDEIAAIPLSHQLCAEVTADIEWHFTTHEVAGLIEAVAAYPSMAINPGPIEVEPWARIAYKGGSEKGILCSAACMTGHDGRVHTVIATWNDDMELDPDRLRVPFGALLRCLVPPSPSSA